MGRTQHRIRPTGTYFITINCWGDRQILKGEVAEILTDQILRCRKKGYYCLHEFCVMPNHLHVLFTPATGATLEKAVQMIKGGASYRIRRKKNFHTIWQDGYHDWRCRTVEDYSNYAEYIRQNPVKAGLTTEEGAWPYSSANPKFAEFLSPLPQGLKAKGSGESRVSTLKG